MGCPSQSLWFHKFYYVLLFHPMSQLVICFNSPCSVWILRWPINLGNSHLILYLIPIIPISDNPKEPYLPLSTNYTCTTLCTLSPSQLSYTELPRWRSVISPTRKETITEARKGRAISIISGNDLSSNSFSLQVNVPKEIHAILTETLTCFLPGQAIDLSAPLYYVTHSNNTETRAVIKFYSPTRQGAEGNSHHSDRNISLFTSWSG